MVPPGGPAHGSNHCGHSFFHHADTAGNRLDVEDIREWQALALRGRRGSCNHDEHEQPYDQDLHDHNKHEQSYDQGLNDP
eukprot:3056000-Heterocapsa_arctica.AAC.1